MTETNVFQLSQPGSLNDPLTEVLRDGARALLAQAIEAEVATLLSRYADQSTDDGLRRLVRHGHLPEREIMTGIGPVAVRCPRVRDRVGEGSERIRFHTSLRAGHDDRAYALVVITAPAGIAQPRALPGRLRRTSCAAACAALCTSASPKLFPRNNLTMRRRKRPR